MKEFSYYIFKNRFHGGREIRTHARRPMYYLLPSSPFFKALVRWATTVVLGYTIASPIYKPYLWEYVCIHALLFIYVLIILRRIDKNSLVHTYAQDTYFHVCFKYVSP